MLAPELREKTSTQKWVHTLKDLLAKNKDQILKKDKVREIYELLERQTLEKNY